MDVSLHLAVKSQPKVLLNAVLIYSSLIDLACADRVAAALALGGVPLAEVVVVVLDSLEGRKGVNQKIILRYQSNARTKNLLSFWDLFQAVMRPVPKHTAACLTQARSLLLPLPFLFPLYSPRSPSLSL